MDEFPNVGVTGLVLTASNSPSVFEFAVPTKSMFLVGPAPWVGHEKAPPVHS